MATVVDFEAGSGWNRNGPRATRDAVVNVARRFESDILLTGSGRRANAKDGMAIDALRVRSGTAVQVRVAAPDEDAALQAVDSLEKR
ncbi:HPr family phosphocarrier protein [Paraburkholderia ferrariae]|uniref:HPr family phosphocarrier protein n=1 Tax=Paraburkholderia ferrariae TaxID=386056 RepID=UPI000487DD38|nr:HPr family phosphocarrier protein [Paraburkholderia ferrariae]